MSGALMAAEMGEQPRVLGRLVELFDAQRDLVRSILPGQLAGTVFVARGSSDHAAVYGRYLAELAAGRPAGLTAPSVHTLYRAEVDYEGYLAVALSQSGATPEIVDVCARLREAGARTLAIVNDSHSPLTGAVDAVLPLDAGPERAIPATKTVTAEFLAVAVVATALGPVPFDREDLERLPGAVGDVLAEPGPPAELATSWADKERLFVAARGLLLASALEGALKIKETTGVLAEGISAADLRHGPIAAVGPAAPVLVLDGGGPPAQDLRELAGLLQSRGAPTAVCGVSGADLSLPDSLPEALTAIVAIVRLQQLAFKLAGTRGLDPDAPAGLSKVTATK
jgi:glutamine---fructose-6-phosphate transaminase (isomerizing)